MSIIGMVIAWLMVFCNIIGNSSFKPIESRTPCIVSSNADTNLEKCQRPDLKIKHVGRVGVVAAGILRLLTGSETSSVMMVDIISLF